MRRIRKKLLLYGLVAVFLLSVMSVAMADTEENSAVPDAEQQITSVFKDVTSSDSNLVYINYLAKREIISGFPDGGFHPAEGLSRAQAATLLVKAAGLEPAEVKTNVFKDVDPAHWAAGNIAAASAAGYLKGYPDGNYHPEEKLSRAQGISLVLRLSQQEDPGVELPQLKDMDNNHWAARSAAIGLAAGMVGLTADKTQFLPDGDFTRGDLSRALAVLLTTDPGLNQAELDGSLEVKAGIVKVNNQTIEKSTTIKAGDTIITAAGGEAQLSYPDGSGLLVKENSTLQVKETRGTSYIKADGAPGTAVDWLLADLKKGEVFGALATNPNVKEEETQETAGGKLLASLSGGLNLLAAQGQAPPWYQTANQKKVKVEVDMPWGVAAVRGSFWSNLVTNSGCSTSLLEGEAEVSAGGQTQPLQPGNSSAVNQGAAAPTPPAPMSAEQVTQWVQQAAWLQNVAQTMQANQAAVQTAAGITTPVQQPGQPAPVPTAPPAPPAPPVVQNILNTVSQALTQVVQQQTGSQTTIDLNNLSNTNIESVLQQVVNSNPGSGGTGGTSTTDTDSSSTSNFLSKITKTPAYLYVNSLTVNSGSMNLSGRTAPNNNVMISSPMLQTYPDYCLRTTADANGYFSFTGVNVSSGAAAEGQNCLWVHQMLGDSCEQGVKSELVIDDVLNIPQLPLCIEVERGVYTTDIIINGKVTPGQAQTVSIYEAGCAATAQLLGTGSSNAASGAFSINIGSAAPGTQLSVQIGGPGSEEIAAWAHSYVYSASSVSVIAAYPSTGYPVGTDLDQIAIFFDRNVSQGSSFSSINVSPLEESSISVSLSGNVLLIDITQALDYSQTYSVSIPAGAIVDALNSSNALSSYSYQFTTTTGGSASITSIAPFPAVQIYAGDPCILPATVRANMSDGSVSEVPVTWSPSTINTSTPGTYPINGTVEGYSGSVAFNLVVNSIPTTSDEGTVFYEDFEDTLSGWTKDGLWNVLADGSDIKNEAVPKYVILPYGDVSGGYLPNTPYGGACLWYGKTSSTNPYEVGNYLNEQTSNDSDLSGGHSMSPHMGSAITPVITVPSTGSPALSFNSWWEIESVEPAGFDIMTVHILDADGYELEQLARINPSSAPSGSAPLAYTSAGKDIPGVWQSYSYDLSDYLGQNIKIKFQFNTNDGQYNGFRGWFIDEVKVLGEAPADDGWSLVGNFLTAGADSELGFVIGETEVNVACADGSNHAMVYSNNLSEPTNWNLVGDSIVTDGSIIDLSLQGDTPVMAYVYANNPVVANYIDGSWTPLSGGTTPEGPTTSLSLDVGLDGVPYLAYINTVATSNYVYVFVYGSNAWESLGGMDGSYIIPVAEDANSSENASINTAGSTPYMAYINYTGYPTVLQYAGDYCWDDLTCCDPNLPSSVSSLALTAACEGYPYIAFSDGSGGKVMQYMYDDDVNDYIWSAIGNATDDYYFSTASADSISLAVDGCGTPYVAYSEGTIGKLVVKYFDGSNWVPITITDYGQDAVEETRIRVAPDGVYVFYRVGSGAVNLVKHSLPSLNLP